jgi:biotin operon repressor
MLISSEILDKRIWGSLSKSEKTVMLYLMVRADSEKYTCYPAIARIAKELSMGEDTVRKVIKNLGNRFQGFVFKRNKLDGGLDTNLYNVSFLVGVGTEYQGG